MKIIYVLMFGLIMFNIMIIFTNSLGVFPVTEWTGEEINTVNGKDLRNLTGIDLVSASLGGLDWRALTALGGVFALTAIGAALTRSPVLLGVGGFAAVSTGVITQTYFTLEQFPIPSYFLLAGTIGLGVLMVINVIEMSGGGNDG